MRGLTWREFSPGHLADSVRTGSDGGGRVPRRLDSIVIGMMGFGGASLLVFGSWALAGRWMFGLLGELGAYLVWMVCFLALGGLALRRAVMGPPRRATFVTLFAAGFVAYSVGWMVAWFLWRNRVGEWVGSVVGATLLAWVFASAFGAGRRFWLVAGCLTVAHSVGYFLGAVGFERVGGKLGMLIWGAAYGIGFGAGLGDALFRCQAPARALLDSMAAAKDGASKES